MTPLDLAYLALAGVTAPVWARKRRDAWPERMGRVEPLRAPEGVPRLMLHAVSLGEVNATKPLVQRLLDADPELHIVLTTTTDTGTERAHTLYDLEKQVGRFHIRRYPLDASWSVRRFLDAVQPSAVLLMELEVWPQFIKACSARSIPVGVVNGRLSARSFKNYAKARPVLRPTFSRLAFAATQDDDYASRFEHMGTPDVHTVGSMKWDSALDAISVLYSQLQVTAEDLRAELGINRDRPLVVAGSTAPGEPALILRAIEGHPRDPALLVAPRRPEWFDPAADVLGPDVVRRSDPGSGDPAAGRFLLDSFGELRYAYALAKAVVIGRSFVDLHGSDPMEAAALAKPIVIGPNTSDFDQPVTALKRCGGLTQTDAEGLGRALDRLLTDDDYRHVAAQEAFDCVQANAGAADRTVTVIRDHMPGLFMTAPDRLRRP